ncbi:MAG: polysaccharide lyase [Pseudomonadota bacterium]|nr:polysaccharide lyase [Pseudomonadota bacterium]
MPIASAATYLLARGGVDSSPPSAGYRTSLVNGYTPKRIDWDGYRWSADMGSTWNADMDHCFRPGEDMARFEIRPTPLDRAANDGPDKRRSELHCTRNRLPNGVPLWGAMSFNHHRWSDPAGMAQGGWGGVHGQIHMGKFGGSPALAFRRTRDGRFLVTTRGQYDDGNNRRWMAPVSFNERHDLVYRVLLHPSQGELDLWLDGRHVVNVAGASIGSERGGSYWCIGCYYSGGISCPIVAEYANHAFPSPTNLSARISERPAWPIA